MRNSGRASRQTDSAPRLAVERDPYALFGQIDGTHSLKSAVPDGYVDYQVRKRRGGKIAFFNFELAKEMGLIPADHPHRINPALAERLLDTFALVIINEWDLENNRRFPKEDIKPNRYMATRYLQLQHPSKKGKTSGDGRGIWNGEFRAKGVTWDISSSGTGATCLSPAVAIQKKFFRTGDPRVCYGSGYNTVDDGFNTALMSEVFHLNGVPTERTLVIVEFPGGSSINVRASRNLLRPSHFFHHLKQGNLESLRNSIDYFIERQIANGEWSHPPVRASAGGLYEWFAEQMALTFSRLVAQFESEYIFCWLDWDGDNILASGGIIDYGSVRQFGLFHDEYRYDDVDRFSTKLLEQKFKARYLVQTFAQIRDFLIAGRKRNIKKFRNDPLLKLFDRNYQRWMDEFTLRRIGFEHGERALLMRAHSREVAEFRRIFEYFERIQSVRGVYKVADGVTSNAVFSMRECLRELPRHLAAQKVTRMEAREFIQMMKSSYARRRDLELAPSRAQRVEEFQKRYVRLLELASTHRHGGSFERMLAAVTMRSSWINRRDRITGDGIIGVTDTMLKLRKRLTQAEMQEVFERFVHSHVLDPVAQKALKFRPLERVERAIEVVRRHILRNCEGL